MFVFVLFCRYPKRFTSYRYYPSRKYVLQDILIALRGYIYYGMYASPQSYIPAFVPLTKGSLAIKTSLHFALDSFIQLGVVRQTWKTLLYTSWGSLCLLCSEVNDYHEENSSFLVPKVESAMLQRPLILFEEDMYLYFLKKMLVYPASRKTPAYYATRGGWLFLVM